MGGAAAVCLTWPLITDHCFLVGAAGIEPATTGLEIRCSIHLSYAPVRTDVIQPIKNTLVNWLGTALECLGPRALEGGTLRFSEFVQGVGKEGVGLEVIRL